MRQQATGVVMAQVLLEPEPQTTDEVESLDPLQEWMGPDGMPKDRTHPLWAMAEDETVSPEQFRVALREWTAQLPTN